MVIFDIWRCTTYLFRAALNYPVSKDCLIFVVYVYVTDNILLIIFSNLSMVIVDHHVVVGCVHTGSER